MARDAIFFLVLVVVVLALVAAAWDRFILDPRVESVIVPAAAHLGSVAAVASALPPAQRDEFLKAIVQRSEGDMALDDPQRWGLSEPASPVRARGLAMLRAELPDQVIAFSAEGGNQFWMSLPDGSSGEARWLRMRAAGDDQGRASLLAAVTAGVALFGIAAALLLGLQARKQVHGWAATSLPATDADDVPSLEDATIHLRALHALDAQASSAARESLVQLEQLCKRLAGGPLPPASAIAPSAPAGPPATRWTAMRGRLRVDFLADVATILVLLGLVLGGLGWTFERLIAQPRFDSAADFVAIQIRGMRNAFQALPPERRQAFVGDLSRIGRGRLQVDDPSRWLLAPPRTRVYQEFFDSLRKRLPGVDMAITPEPVRLLWFSLGPGSGADPTSRGEVWVRLRAGGAPGDLQVLARSIFLVVVVVAVFVVWRGRRRAERLMLALRRMRDERQGPASSSADDEVDDAELVMTADPRLRQSFEQVIRQREKVELGRAQLARQAHDCIARLRLLRPAGAAGAAFEALLDPLEQWVSRIEPHAATAGAGEADVIDINDVLARVSQYAEVPVRLEQGGVPYVNLHPSAALRLLRALIEGLEPDFAVGVDITSMMEHGWVVVQVRDPVGAASEAQLLAREGIEVARNLASTHGGVLRLAPLPDGGWQAEVWLPCARL